LAWAFGDQECGVWRQPLENVKDYFGEKIAFYFAFLGFYTHSLVPVAVSGLVLGTVYFVGLSMSQNHLMAQRKEIQGGESHMEIQDGMSHMATGTFDPHTQTPYKVAVFAACLYTIHILIFAIQFLETWKQEASEMAHFWGTGTLVEKRSKDEIVRPTFEGKYDEERETLVRDPEREPEENQRAVITTLVIIAWCGVSLLVLSVMDHFAIYDKKNLHTYQALMGIAILIMESAFKRIADYLASLTKHRTDREYQTGSS
jgi:hypothetical protein